MTIKPTCIQQKLISHIKNQLNIDTPEFTQSWEISAFIDHHLDFANDPLSQNTITIENVRYLTVSKIAAKENVTPTAIKNRIERKISSNYPYLSYNGKEWIDQQSYLRIKK